MLREAGPQEMNAVNQRFLIQGRCDITCDMQVRCDILHCSNNMDAIIWADSVESEEFKFQSIMW